LDFAEGQQRTRKRGQAEACAAWGEVSVGYGDVVAGGQADGEAEGDGAGEEEGEIDEGVVGAEGSPAIFNGDGADGFDGERRKDE